MADSYLCSTSQWIQFFRNAGLPPNVSANYAIIFSDNRIQQNMLMDLSKEYLYDMGIKVMGDVIAILKYSKEFHNQLAQEKVMGSETKFLLPSKRSSPAIRILGHYTRPVGAAPNGQTLDTNTCQKIVTGSPKKRILSLNKESSIYEGNPMKKVRRVLPEEEGGYRIKMPTGTTERTRKILEQQTQLASKKSVFERLGDSDVSSSTDVKRSQSFGSVFNRLGPSTGEVSTSTSDQGRDVPLTYRGVLKPDTKVKKIITTVNYEPTVGRASTAPKVSILNRLGTRPVAQAKRTVVNNYTGSAGVMQINNILQRNAQLNSVQGSPAPSHGILGCKQAAPIRTSIIGRLGVKSNAMTTTSGNQASMSKTIVLNRSSSQFNRLRQSSVFQRLGK